jgi:hypothetical protein
VHEKGFDQPVEVELAHKSTARLRGILTLHAAWRSEGRSKGVVYVCGDQDVADRVRHAADRAFGPNWSGLTTRLLSSVQRAAVETREATSRRRATRTWRCGLDDRGGLTEWQ